MYDDSSFKELTRILATAYQMGAHDTAKAIINELRTRLAESEFYENAVRQG